MKSTFPVISSPLQRYHDETFPVITAHNPQFSGNILCKNVESASIKTYCSPISDTTAGFPRVPYKV
jgi:hypothetical protein